VAELGCFRDGDFVATEEAARLAKKLLKKHRRNHVELTRGMLRRLVIEVLARCWYDLGPSRVRLETATLLEVLELGDQ
jgi:hypothetical protein